MNSSPSKAAVRSKGYQLQYRVREVLELLNPPRTDADVEQAFAEARALERFRDERSSRVLDALDRVLTVRFREGAEDEIVRLAYVELQASLKELQERTGAVKRSTLRIAGIYLAASAIAWSGSLLLTHLLRLAFAPDSLTGSPTPDPQRLIFAVAANAVVIPVLLAAFMRVRHHGWEIAFLVAVVAAGVPQQWYRPIFDAADQVGSFLASSFGWQLADVVLRAPFYVLESWLVMVLATAGLDWWWRRAWGRRWARESSSIV